MGGAEEGGGNDPSRTTQQYRSFQSNPRAPKDLVMLQLLPSGFGKVSYQAWENHEQVGYYDDAGGWHGSSETSTRPFRSGSYIGHSTSVKKGLEIMIQGSIEPSVPPLSGNGPPHCPAGHPGVYGFPLDSTSEEDVAKFMLDPNAYKKGCVVILKVWGAIVKGSSNFVLKDGMVGYHQQQNNKLLQVAAHPSTLEHS